jgi:hypothetical protein
MGGMGGVGAVDTDTGGIEGGVGKEAELATL